MAEIMNISGANTTDYVLINANIRAIFNDNYHCDEYKNTLKARNSNRGEDFINERIKAYVDSRGCEKPVSHRVDRVENIEFSRCLCSLKHPYMSQIMSLLYQYEKGVMPFEGSMMEQPAQVIELLDIARVAKDREMMIRQESKNGK